jgi:hypothetical protein
MVHETVTYWHQLCEEYMLLLHISVLNQRDSVQKHWHAGEKEHDIRT